MRMLFVVKDLRGALPSYVTEPLVPLQLNEKRNLFKLFMGITGLLLCILHGKYPV